MNYLKNIIMLSLLISCSSGGGNSKSEISRTKKYYELTDHSGKFTMVRETGKSKKSNDLVAITTIFPLEGDEKKPLEKSITISTPGMLNKIPVYRPRISNYFIWFDDSKEKYFTKMSVNVATRSIDISMKSPEEKWNGKRSIPFPEGSGVFCFFNQVVECVKRTNFFKEAIKQGDGNMNFHIIWDGYPYVQEQLLGIPDRIFEPVSMVYEKNEKKNLYQFTLKVAGQAIIYFLDNDYNLVKKFWTTQGVSIIKKVD
ncbi:MAG: hypothetical protein A2381_09710 [Bdellovibrionales bacterium RIFOXYB1_FULL_37_110]|nr:MAG: hypothetical protein A2181_02790 [Bdellovibrionales bacterium RIFOXYA1_FULL_38_20]OFZ47205.1 MAG: hypothetical protein A2417_06810 [Bdellovibrionales bacterium RIFOXYC1_FULL_37_79]OFZ59545.1 MAG: hypothetical protein A2381_09710 [Bdellovibrionales bacterium RIFOXYB1_FULL_37_110]OFZ62476.1 MAG: hypothetical protein A2577_03545 [Bdellovibrionales bacterium RIFOXYD1_FULL_36_51]OFZ64444.1 MAG: hypothetical protein A2328_08905 [Bdellovibrionales bacterium RIFOXYB2_FULL_36_6]